MVNIATINLKCRTIRKNNCNYGLWIIYILYEKNLSSSLTENYPRFDSGKKQKVQVKKKMSKFGSISKTNV